MSRHSTGLSLQRTKAPFLNRKLKVLAVVCLCERMSRKLRHCIGNAIGTVVFVGELLVCIGEQCDRGVVSTLNCEAEFSSLHVAADQGLFNLNAVIGAARSVLVGKRHCTICTIGVGYLGLERAGMVVGHRYLRRFRRQQEPLRHSTSSRSR